MQFAHLMYAICIEHLNPFLATIVSLTKIVDHILIFKILNMLSKLSTDITNASQLDIDSCWWNESF